MAKKQKSGNGYTGKNVQVLRDAEHIRRRPGVYIGDVGPNGLHHLVYELVYNCVDEALAGFCNSVNVIISPDNSVTVVDDGRGIPVDIHPEHKKPTIELVLTTVGAGAKFDNDTYKVAAGLHGMGAKAVTALSEWVGAEVRRDGYIWTQEYERGKAITELKRKGKTEERGTKITFKPDPQIFETREFEYKRLQTRFRELAFLNKGLSIHLRDERTGEEETFFYAGGIAEFVSFINRQADTLHRIPIYIEKVIEDVRVEVAIQYTTSDEEQVRCYTNNAYNPQGGTHLSGFRTALTRTLNSYGQRESAFKNDITPIGEDFREGLTAIVSIQMAEPQFESQTKVKLNNSEIDGIVSQSVMEGLNAWIEQNPKEAQKIIKKVALAAEARIAAAKAKKALRDRKSILSGGGLPGKLMDCTTRDRDISELFLVEGQSAGGSAEGGRDRIYQAILPLRGKVLNVEKSRQEKLLSNEEICSLISAVGIDIGENDDLKTLRYGKIVILTDADVDGQHIRTLLLTFFYRQMRHLVERGHLYVARPPLYKITDKKKIRYLHDAEQMAKELLQRGLSEIKLSVQQGRKTREVENVEDIMDILIPIDEAMFGMERKGVDLNKFLRENTGRLPRFRVQDQWFFEEEDLDHYLELQNRSLGIEYIDEEYKHSYPLITTHYFGEVEVIQQGLDKLKKYDFTATDLIRNDKIWVLESGQSRRTLISLRDMVSEVRRLGERGLAVTRFKGLGEMDAEELWETTLDPEKRTLQRVCLEDMMQANELFQILMGEKVEPRKQFIFEHAINVKELDYHGA